MSKNLKNLAAEKILKNSENKNFKNGKICGEKKFKKMADFCEKNGKIRAEKIPIFLPKILEKNLEKIKFKFRGKIFSLFWTGEFFAKNAALAIAAALECGAKISQIQKFLPEISPPISALQIRKNPRGAAILCDFYSANPDGIFAALKILARGRGRKIFVGIPLIELGKTAEKIHEKIFQNLKKIGAEIFWLKTDFSKIGREICGQKFHGKNFLKLKKFAKNLRKNDFVLLESRLPAEISEIFLK